MARENDNKRGRAANGSSRSPRPKGRDGRPGRGRTSTDAAEAKERRKKRAEKAKARQTGVPGDEVPQAHEPVLEVRAFSSVDFSQLVRIMPPEWLFAGMSEAETEAQAQMDLAGCLSSCTLALVATVDDGTDYDPVVAGALLGYVDGEAPLFGADRWQEAYEDAGETLRYGCPQARQAYAYVTQLEERCRLLVEAAGDARGTENELVLFVTRSSMRGHGVGRALVETFEQHLREAGQTSYWLATDSLCSWQWYEAHGFTRCADVELGPEFALPPGDPAINDMLDPVQSAGGDGERPHAFMYRKEL